MRNVLCLALLMSCGLLSVEAQNPYLVKTASTSTQTASANATDDFIQLNFPRQHLADWTPGMKFMVIPARTDLIIPTFRDAATDKNVGSADLQYKILEYQGYEITQDRGFLHFNFYCEETNKNYYHEEKNTTFADFCAKPKAGINTLAYLGDVDKAKELLTGTTLYTAAGTYSVDDANSQGGVRQIQVAKNTPVKVVNVGVGTRAYPVKLVVKDANGREFFQHVAISKTNCGMRDNEFIMDNTKYYFPNSFSLVNPNEKKSKSVTAQYMGKTVYLKKRANMVGPTGDKVIKRYTSFVVKSLDVINNTNYYTGVFEREGHDYTMKVTFTNETVIGDIAGYNEAYFTDLFGMGNIRAQHAKTADAVWDKVVEGKVEIGMSKSECKLAKGDPMRTYRDPATGREDWIYEDHMILCFNKGYLTTIK